MWAGSKANSQKEKQNGAKMGLRRLARQIKTGRRKAAMAAGYAAYVEAETQAGRKPTSKRDWRRLPTVTPAP